MKLTIQIRKDGSAKGPGSAPKDMSELSAPRTVVETLRRNLRGVLLMILATGCLSSMHGLVRYEASELHPFEIAFFRNFFVPLFLLPWLIRTGWTNLRPRRLHLQLWRALIGVGALLAWFYSLSLLPLADATALNFTSTIFATIGAAVILRERVRLHRWVAVIVGFVGVVIILQPGQDAASIGGALVLVASLLWAGALLLAKALTRYDSTLGIVAGMAGLSALFAFPPALLVWETPSVHQIGVLLVIAALGTLGWLFFIQALREADASVVLPLDFLRLLWAVFFGYLLFGELPSLIGWIGAILIVGSATYIGFREITKE